MFSLNTNSKKILSIWDFPGEPNKTKIETSSCVYWNRAPQKKSHKYVSFLEIAEKNDRKIRKKVIDWINRLGSKKTQGETVARQLKIRNKLSAWWFTSLSEKCNYDRFIELEQILRIFILKNYLSSNNFKKIIFFSDNEQIAYCIKNICSKSKTHFEWRKKNNKKVILPLAFTKQTYFKKIVKSIIYLFQYIFLYQSAFFLFKKLSYKQNSDITIISYNLFNLLNHPNKKEIKKNQYWGPLCNLLNKKNIRTSWLYLSLRRKTFFDVRPIKIKEKCFCKNELSRDSHNLIDAFFDLGVLRKTINDWFFLIKKFKDVSKSLKANAGDLWPLIQHPWEESILGPLAIDTLLNLNLFEKIFKCLPKQKMLLFLCENQPWERALLHAWKAAGHGKTIGFAHSFLRFWDLRYFQCKKVFSDNSPDKLPRPDLLAVNGPLAKDELLRAGHPSNEILQVEALRYLDLLKKRKSKNLKNKKNNLKVLLLGDYNNERNNILNNLVIEALEKSNKAFTCTVKPHPAVKNSVFDKNRLPFILSKEPLTKLLDTHNCVISSSSTTAACEAFIFGVPVIISAESHKLNLSPLRKIKGIKFVFSASQLCRELNKIQSRSQPKGNSREIFYLNNKLPRWQAFFNRYYN